MNTRFRLFRRANGIFYCEDAESRRQQSLRTKKRDEAERLIHAKNEACIQPRVNLQIARAYLMATDPEMGRLLDSGIRTIEEVRTFILEADELHC